MCCFFIFFNSAVAVILIVLVFLLMAPLNRFRGCARASDTVSVAYPCLTRSERRGHKLFSTTTKRVAQTAGTNRLHIRHPLNTCAKKAAPFQVGGPGQKSILTLSVHGETGLDVGMPPRISKPGPDRAGIVVLAEYFQREREAVE